MRLRPLQGPTQRGLPTSIHPPLRRATKSAQLATLMEFFPLRRMSPSESTPRRLATPTTFRPQGFSPSRRLPPRSNAQPCFMPVTSMGFHSPGVYPRCQVHPAHHRVDYPPGVSPPHCTVNSAMLGRPLLRKPNQGPNVTSLFRLQGFAPTANPYRRRIVTSNAHGRSPPELSTPLQGLAFAFRPRRASVSRSCAFSDSSSNSPGTSPKLTSKVPGCASAVSPENAGFRSEERDIPS